MAFRQRLEGLLSGGDQIGNLGLGLLAASGPSAVPQSFGQVLASGVNHASSRRMESLKNDAMREQLAQVKRQREAMTQLQGLLASGESPSDPRQMLGLIGEIAPEQLAQTMLARTLPKPSTLESPIGKLLNDRALVAAGGDAKALAAIDSAIKDELGSSTDIKDVLAVRDDVTRNSKDFLEAQTGFQKVQAAAQTETPAGDMALIFGYMKVLDPSSVVREGEFANVQNTGSVPERIWGTYNRILRGERLTPSQRQDFSSQAHSQFMPLVEQQQRLIRDAQSFAERNAMKFEDIVPEFVMPILPAPVSAPTARGVRETTGGLADTITSDLRSLLNGQSPGAAIAPVVEGANRAVTRAADVARMSLQQLEALDATGLSSEILEAAAARYQQLRGGANAAR